MTAKERFNSEIATTNHDRGFMSFSAAEMNDMARRARGIFELDPKANVYTDSRCNLCGEPEAVIKWHMSKYLEKNQLVALNWTHWRESMKIKFVEDEFVFKGPSPFPIFYSIYPSSSPQSPPGT